MLPLISGKNYTSGLVRVKYGITVNMYPTNPEAIIFGISCYGHEAIIDSCNISRSYSNCASFPISAVSCIPRQRKHFIYNRPTYCSFQYGMCNWSSSGRSTWNGHPQDNKHFKPFTYSNYLGFVYAYRAQGSTSPVKATLTSPLICQESYRTLYV
ncbi:hypothetical protein TrispH2_010593 [Trichoplax sp. H2]|nr:hypothetical protein TrispH2_010593 [Trichoplax sp. H2]|eukprot:RDD37227.1 hypothetical protein TrispH2_010593 [Trichoplax sp. H2]